MSATATSTWQTVAHRKNVSLPVYLITVAVLIAALAVTLAAGLVGGHSSASPGKPISSVQDYCNIRAVGAPC